MKRIGRLNNKPVVIGNENKLTKNEILLKNESDNKVSLSVNRGGIKLITGSESSYKYYRFDIQQYTQDMIAKYNSEMISSITVGSVDILPFGFYVYFKPLDMGTWSLNGYHNGIYAQEDATFSIYLTPTILILKTDDNGTARDLMDLSKPIYLIDNPLLYSIIMESGGSFVQSPLARRSPYEHIKYMIDSLNFTGENKEVLNHMVDYIIPITKEEFDQAIQTK